MIQEEVWASPELLKLPGHVASPWRLVVMITLSNTGILRAVYPERRSEILLPQGGIRMTAKGSE
jgi:hypothetical protein